MYYFVGSNTHSNANIFVANIFVQQVKKSFCPLCKMYNI